MGIQPDTTKLQAAFPFEKNERVPHPLDLAKLYSKTTYLAALLYVIECGNFQYDKQVYQHLGIDKGNWARMKSGEASFPQEKEEALQDLCGNDGLVLWRAFRRGKGVYDLQEAKDREIAQLKAERDQLRREIETLTKYGVIGRAK